MANLTLVAGQALKGAVPNALQQAQLAFQRLPQPLQKFMAATWPLAAAATHVGVRSAALPCPLTEMAIFRPDL